VALVAIAAIAWSMLGGGQVARASNGYEQWMGPYNTGCYYYTDGYSASIAACPRGDGANDFYLAANGQWAYSFTAGYDANGCYYVTDGDNTVYACPDTVFTNYTDSWLDGMSSGNEGSWTTGNAQIDAMMISFNAQLNATWVQPTCVQVIGNVCYYQS
jgi:hypothetical protein